MRYEYAKNVLAVLGYFWQRVWKDEDFVSGLASAVGTMQQQTDITYNEFEEYMSRLTLPVTSHLRWKKITLRRDEMKLRPYGVFDGLQTGRSVLIGSSVPPIQYVFPWSSALQTSFIVNSPSINASTVLSIETDYTIEDDQIIFFRDPFDILPLGGTVDENQDPVQTVECWGYCSEEDSLNVRNFFGTYVGINTESTELFKRLTNAIWDLYTEGATINNINNFLLVFTDCDSVTQDGTVQDIFTEAGRIWVSTENGLYGAPEGVSVIVSVDDEIYKGQNIFNTFSIYEGREVIPDTVVASFVAESGYLGGGYIAGLSFDNREVDLTFTYTTGDDEIQILQTEAGEVLIIDKEGDEYILTGPDDYLNSDLQAKGVAAVPIFEIGGFPEDVALFRSKIAEYIAENNVDIITKLTFDQAPPYKINPFEYIQEASLRNNLIFIELNADFIVSTQAMTASLRYLANTVPAGTAFMIYLSSTFPEEVYDLSSEVEETVTGYIVSELAEEYSDSNIVDTIHANKKVG